jgi:hypothetical protein
MGMLVSYSAMADSIRLLMGQAPLTHHTNIGSFIPCIV